MTLEPVLMTRSADGHGEVTTQAYGPAVVRVRGDLRVARDLGGYRTTTGQLVRRRKLFRAEGSLPASARAATVIELCLPGADLTVADAGRHRLPVTGALDKDGSTIAETLAVLTDPWAYPAILLCSAGGERAALVTTVVLGVLGVDGRDIVTEAGTRSGIDAVRRRYGTFDRYAEAMGVGSAVGYIQAALLI